MAYDPKKTEYLLATPPGEPAFDEGGGVRYPDVAEKVGYSTGGGGGGGGTTPEPTPSKTTSTSDEAERIRKQIADIEKQIETKQAQIDLSEKVGIPSDEEIPEYVMDLGESLAGSEIVDYSDTKAKVEGILSRFESRKEDILREQEMQMQKMVGSIRERGERQTELLSEMLQERQDLAEERPEITSTYKRALESFGIDEKTFEKQEELTSEINAINAQIAKVDEQALAREDRVDAQGMPRMWVQGKKAQIQRAAAARKNSLAAEAQGLAAEHEAIRGRVAQARSFAELYVKSATADWEQRVKDFEFVYKTKADLVNSLDSTEREILDLVYSYNKEQLSLAREEETQKMNLILDAAQKGITLPVNGSLEDTQRMYVKSVASLPQETQAPTVIGTAETGYHMWDPEQGRFVPTGIGAGDGGGTGAGFIVETDDGERIDLATLEGLRKAQDKGYPREYIQALLDENTKWNVSTITGMLDRAGFTTVEEETRTLTDGSLRKAIHGYFDEGLTRSAIENEIEFSETMSREDKERAKEILRQEFSGEPEESNNKWWQFWK